MTSSSISSAVSRAPYPVPDDVRRKQDIRIHTIVLDEIFKPLLIARVAGFGLGAIGGACLIKPLFVSFGAMGIGLGVLLVGVFSIAGAYTIIMGVSKLGQIDVASDDRVQVMLDQPYLEWRKEQPKEVVDALQALVNRRPELQNLKCPSTNELPIIPYTEEDETLCKDQECEKSINRYLKKYCQTFSERDEWHFSVKYALKMQNALIETFEDRTALAQVDERYREKVIFGLVFYACSYLDFHNRVMVAIRDKTLSRRPPSNWLFPQRKRESIVKETVKVISEHMATADDFIRRITQTPGFLAYGTSEALVAQLSDKLGKFREQFEKAAFEARKLPSEVVQS